MKKRKKHITVICDQCGKSALVAAGRPTVKAGDPDPRRGIPCRMTPGCTGRAREPEQLTLPGLTPTQKPDEQQQLGF